jgi:RNA polymerase sigma-70 factor, ECF subfamily
MAAESPQKTQGAAHNRGEWLLCCGLRPKAGLGRHMDKFAPDPEPTADADLIEAMNLGHVEAFEELYQRHRDWVFRLAYRFTGNEQDALDVMQETFTYFLKRTPKLALWVKLTTFLYPAVKNISLTLRRKKGRSGAVDGVLEQIPAREESPYTAFHKTDLVGVLAALPEAHREVLLMRFVDGMSLEEIGESLQIPIGTVKSRLHNAIAKLREDRRTRGYFRIS